ncbi:MAG: aminoacyl-histidine dipeptidase [Lachnospiraceae bacterium]|nr:aminoacyl-histidine dipeptidase [Lachnospiraceae bacterium]
MGVLENTEPKEVFRFFEDLTRIPRGSGNEKAVSDYVVKFARDRGLEVIQDDLYNVIVKCPASPGYEDVPGFILQGHLDMVCEKTDDCPIDFEKDPLEIYIDGDGLTAKGTTLGGDDGVAVAYILAIMDSKDLPHPSIEAVLTISEETGMEGAAHIDLSSLKNRKLLNLDSEDEGVFLTGCAGGGRADVRMKIEREEKSGIRMEVALKGFAGGHSGEGIIKGGGNADLMISRLVSYITARTGAGLVSMAGGTKDNAIPRAASAEFIVDGGEKEAFIAAAEEGAGKICAEYRVTDPEAHVEMNERGEGSDQVLTTASLRKVLALVLILPNGVQAMSADVKGLVETSLNLGIMKTDKDEISFSYLVRSSVNSAKEFLLERIKRITEELGGSYSLSGVYPAWQYRPDSPLRDQMIRVYKDMYGEEPQVQAIHAGVECGLISDKLPGVDAVSIGPNMRDIHTTEETLSISSTKRVWEYVCALLADK